MAEHSGAGTSAEAMARPSHLLQIASAPARVSAGDPPASFSEMGLCCSPARGETEGRSSPSPFPHRRGVALRSSSSTTE